jgi:hypothetical protein
MLLSPARGRGWVRGLRRMASSEDLRDVWYAEDGKVIAREDAAAIDEMLATKLEEVRTEEGGWVVIFRHRDTNQLWELSYPQSELHGGGPRRLRLVDEAS